MPPEEVEEVRLPQVRDLVGEAFFVDQQGEGDLRLLAEEPGVVGVPKTDYGEGCPGFLNLQLMIAQLRDMLAAEDSSIVTQEDEHRGSFFPQGPEGELRGRLDPGVQWGRGRRRRWNSSSASSDHGAGLHADPTADWQGVQCALR